MPSTVYILAIESSCDDTAAAVIRNDEVLANIVANQDVHKAYGGVVPELASRSHQKNIVPVVEQALKVAGIDKGQLNAVACTIGPGLLGSLLVGTSFAKSLSQVLGVPFIGVHHMQGHIMSHFIQEPGNRIEVPQYPYLCLTVSGGHTQLLEVSAPLETKLLGETIDDAAGEAFDKGAKLMGLDYPGGPLVDKLAKEGDPHRFDFAKPAVPDLQFSFSGLKTSFLYFLQKEKQKNERFIEENLNDLCASYQRVIVEILMDKVAKAIKQTGLKGLAVAGGVSANSALRSAVEAYGKTHDIPVFTPPLKYATDNAAMIAITAYHQYLKEDFGSLDQRALARMPME